MSLRKDYPAKPITTEKLDETLDVLSSLQQRFVQDNSRWEVVAEYTDVLGRVLLGDGRGYGICCLPESFIKLVIKGDGSHFMGLEGLASYGDPLDLKSKIAAKEPSSSVVALKNWSKELMQKVTQGGESMSTNDFSDAVEILKGEFDSAVSQLTTTASTMLDSVVAKLREYCVKTMQNAVQQLRKELCPANPGGSLTCKAGSISMQAREVFPLTS